MTLNSIIAKLNELTAEVNLLLQEEETLKFVLTDEREVEVKGNGDVVADGNILEDGEYETKDGMILIVSEGKFMGTKTKEENKEDQEETEIPTEEPVSELKTIQIKGEKYQVEPAIAEYINELEASVEDLSKQVDDLNKQIQVEPAKDTVEQNMSKYNWTSALKFKK